MKKVGFVDYYLSEWHANNYPKWIAQANEALGTDYVLTYAWALEDVSPVDGRTTDQWCEAFGARRCQSAQELCEKSDVIFILAPSNPEKHLELAQLVFPCGKPVYMDKPFADTKENAREIFALAEKYSTPFFSSSALRYATELDSVETCQAITTLGAGSNLPEYIIHQVEMVVKKMGTGATAIKAQRIGDSQCVFTIRYPDDRAAGMHFVRGGAPFTAVMSPADGAPVVHQAISSPFFALLIQDILRFFESGVSSFDSKETLEVNKIMVAAIQAQDQPDQWLTL